MVIVGWIGSCIAEDKGSGGGNQKNPHHEVLHSLAEDLTESLGLGVLSEVVTESCGTVWEVLSRETLVKLNVQLLTETISTCGYKEHVSTRDPEKLVR